MSFKTPHSTARKKKVQEHGFWDHPATVKKRKKINLRGSSISKHLVDEKWNCYSCSPLYQFNKTSIEDYSKQLWSYFVANSDEHQLQYEPSISYPTVTFTTLEDLATHEDEPDSVKIVVKTPGKRQPLTIYLCSVDVSRKFPAKHSRTQSDDEEPNNFYFLPLLLYSGPKAAFKTVASWLEINFICYIQPMFFNPIDLSWMMSMWSNVKRRKTKPYSIEFTWRPPQQDTNHRKIKLRFSPESMSDIWRSLKPPDDNEMTVEDVDNFMERIRLRLKQESNHQLDAPKLFKISTQFVKAGADGFIKIGSPSHIHTVLAHLCCLACERIFPFASDPAE